MASTLKVDNIIATDGTTAPITLSGDAATLGSGVTFPAGHIIQIKYFSTDTAVTAQNTNNATDSWVDVLTSANITMSNQSNKILITGVGSAAGDASGYEFSWRLMRNIGGGSYSAIGGNTDPSDLMLSTNVFMSGMTDGEGGQTHSSSFLDTPNTTQEIIYKLQIQSGETATVYANRGHSTSNIRVWSNTGDTNLTLMEIQQ